MTFLVVDVGLQDILRLALDSAISREIAQSCGHLADTLAGFRRSGTAAGCRFGSMTDTGPGDFINQGDWDDYVADLWKKKPKKLIEAALEQAKIGSENRKLAHGFRDKTASFNEYSGKARDAEARRDAIFQMLHAKETRRAAHFNIALIVATWALVGATIWLALAASSQVVP